MSRASALALSCTLWAAMTGCAQLAPHSACVDCPPKAHDHVGANATDPNIYPKPVHSTAVATEQPERVLTKMPRGPERPQKIEPIPMLDPAPAAPLQKATPKAQPDGVSGVVTIDSPAASPGPAQVVPTAAGLQGPAPADQKKLAPLTLAIQALLEDQHAEAIQHLRAYDEATQEFFLRVGPLVVLFAKKSIDKMTPQEIASFNEQVKGIEHLLRTRCELLITRMAFCRRIGGFADFEPLPDNHAFLARTDNRPGDLVQLYVELKNFASKQMKEGDYLTKLACSLELKNMHGEKVWYHAFDKNDTTHRRSACVNDYHGNYTFYVPALPAGTYQLTIQVVDETIPEHRRVARKSLAFRVTPVANSLPSR